MKRQIDALTRARFDLLVVGGGIHGLFAAYDAAQRGLAVALVDRSDFGSGLSFNHQRTLHGGLRALQHGNIRKTRLQIERMHEARRDIPAERQIDIHYEEMERPQFEGAKFVCSPPLRRRENTSRPACSRG